MSCFFTIAVLVSALHLCDLWVKGDEHTLGPTRAYDQHTSPFIYLLQYKLFLKLKNSKFF